MDYTVTHDTRFVYQGPVHESVMDVRLMPRGDAGQEVLSFELTTDPAAAIFRYVDPLGNTVHHFDIVPAHEQLLVRARTQVRTSPTREVPGRLEPPAWDTLDRMRADGQLWDFFEPSPRVPVSPGVRAFAKASGLERGADPLSCFRQIVAAIHTTLAYAPESTTVDTPIDEALEARRGVCQDFAHIALAIARTHGIPCRYVSGYLAPSTGLHDGRNLMSHAWVEAWLPGLEWTALDPTHDTVAGERHIRVAVGRDYGDAAPTSGVFRGGPAGALAVTVRIEPGGGVASTDEMEMAPARVVPAPPPGIAPPDQ